MSREANGQFAKGNPGGPGRPPRAVEVDYLAALTEAVSPEDWNQIVERAVADAKAGDHKSREWVSKYVIGDRLPGRDGFDDEPHTTRIIIERDPNFYGNEAKVKAAFDPATATARAEQIRELEATYALRATAAQAPAESDHSA